MSNMFVPKLSIIRITSLPALASAGHREQDHDGDEPPVSV